MQTTDGKAYGVSLTDITKQNFQSCSKSKSDPGSLGSTEQTQLDTSLVSQKSSNWPDQTGVSGLGSWT